MRSDRVAGDSPDEAPQLAAVASSMKPSREPRLPLTRRFVTHGVRGADCTTLKLPKIHGRQESSCCIAYSLFIHGSHRTCHESALKRVEWFFDVAKDPSCGKRCGAGGGLSSNISGTVTSPERARIDHYL